MASASIYKTKNGGWEVRFRWENRQFTRNLGRSVVTRKQARNALGEIHTTIDGMKAGRIPLPNDGVSVGNYIFGGAKLQAQVNSISLSKATTKYVAETLDKAEATMGIEKTHHKHFVRLMGADTRLHEISLATIRRYIQTRLKESNRRKGQTISPQTIGKELISFELLWQWAAAANCVSTICPTRNPITRKRVKGLIPKPAEGQPFRQWAEIESKIKLEQLDEEAAKPLWAKVLLSEQEVKELLDYVEHHPKYSFMLPAFALAALAGLRRAEIARAKFSDLDFAKGEITVHERKRKKKQSSSTRIAPMCKRLRGILEKLRTTQHIAVDENGKSVNRERLTELFDNTVHKSKFSVLNGFHLLRHHMCSLALSKGISREIVKEWMGHVSDSTNQLYTHQFLDNKQRAREMLD